MKRKYTIYVAVRRNVVVAKCGGGVRAQQPQKAALQTLSAMDADYAAQCELTLPGIPRP